MQNSKEISTLTSKGPLMQKGYLSKLIDTSSHSVDPDFDPILTSIYKDYTIYQTSSTNITLHHNKSNKTIPFSLTSPLQDFLIYPHNNKGPLYIVILSENCILSIFKVSHLETDDISVKLVKEKRFGNGESPGYFGLALLKEGFVLFAKKEFTICGLTESSFKAKTKTLPEISVGDFNITSYTVNQKRNEVIIYLSKKDEIKIMVLVMSENNKLNKLDFMDIESSEKIKLHEPEEFLNIGLADFWDDNTKECYLYLVSSQGEERQNIKLQKFKSTSRKRPKGRSKRILVFESEKTLELDDNYICSFSNNKCLLWGYNDILIYSLQNCENEFNTCGKIKFTDIEFEGKQHGVELSFDWAEYMDDGCLLVRNSQLIGKVDFDQKEPKKEPVKSNTVKTNVSKKNTKEETDKDNKIKAKTEAEPQNKKKKVVVKTKVETNNKKESNSKKVSFVDNSSTNPNAKQTENNGNPASSTKNKITTTNKPVPPKVAKTTKNANKSGNERINDKLNISIESVLGKVKKQQEDLKEIEEQLKQLLLQK